jgi:N-dimethylarginine dimethylaminohydrolase
MTRSIDMKIGVWNDYGRLREVAVGTTEDMIVPGYNDAYPEFAKEMTRLYAGQPVKNVPVLKELMDRAQVQLDYLAKVYKDHGIIVHRPRKFTEEESTYLNELQLGGFRVMPADPIWIIGRNIIESQFRQPLRNKELFPLRDIIAKRIDEDPNLRVLSCPVTMPGAGDFVLEGGDIQICGNEGKDILVGVDEERSSSARGVEWLRRRLAEDGYTVTPVPITKAAPIHLLGAMGVFGPKGAMIYRPAFKNGIPKPMMDWDLIDITLEEAEAGGPCVVMLDRKTVLIVAEVPRLIKQLEQRGLNVIPIPFDAVTKLDGAVRCATFVIHREKS